MPYPVEHRHLTKERILRSARRLFNRHGFDAVSIDDVMADAGLTRGSFWSPVNIAVRKIFGDNFREILSGQSCRWRKKVSRNGWSRVRKAEETTAQDSRNLSDARCRSAVAEG